MFSPRGRRTPLAAVVIFGLLGVTLASQMNLRRHLSGSPRVAEERLERVIQLYENEQRKFETERSRSDRLQQQVDELRATLDAQQPTSRRLAETERKLDTLTRFAGLAPLQGPGIKVVVQDAKLPVAAEFDQNPYTVHDQDLLLMVNELRAAGAEALALNGQRLVADSEIRCSGPVINVNGIGLTPPYQILALGDPETLSAALASLRGGIVDQLRNVGIEVKITKERNLVVPALSREVTFRYARPARGAEPTGE